MTTCKIKTISAEAFRAMPKRKRALVLVDDVFKLLNSKVIHPDTGIYGFYEGFNLGREFDGDQNFSDPAVHRALLNSTCYVCAKGAFLTSHLLRVGDCSLRAHDVMGVEKLSRSQLVPDVFDAVTFSLIESIFEGWRMIGGIQDIVGSDGVSPSAQAMKAATVDARAGKVWRAKLQKDHDAANKNLNDYARRSKFLRHVLAGILFAIKDGKGDFSVKKLRSLKTIKRRLALMKVKL